MVQGMRRSGMVLAMCGTAEVLAPVWYQLFFNPSGSVRCDGAAAVRHRSACRWQLANVRTVPSPAPQHTVRTLQAQNPRALSTQALAMAAEQMLQCVDAQSKLLVDRNDRNERDERIASQAQAIEFKDAKLEKTTFDLARLKAWRLGAKTATSAPVREPSRRQALPEQPRRVAHHHGPESTTCAARGCVQPMVRIGEDMTEGVDIIPAEFFVQQISTIVTK